MKLPTKAQRAAVSACSSGPVYYDHKAFAYAAVDKALAEFSLTMGLADLNGDSGSLLIPVHPVVDDETDESEIAFYINFNWYRMQSGRYELTAYAT